MNAAERLWRALGRRDWDGARAQFHPAAVVERPSSASSLDVDELIADHREHAARGDFDVHVIRCLSAGTTIVIEARVGSARCAGLYDLHEAKIAGAVEYWVRP
ncbi:MAG TPA: nuclear transport factor 2 family protein [Solirubrobacteraceae bacterium]